jgi:hypothetical protein
MSTRPCVLIPRRERMLRVLVSRRERLLRDRPGTRLFVAHAGDDAQTLQVRLLRGQQSEYPSCSGMRCGLYEVQFHAVDDQEMQRLVALNDNVVHSASRMKALEEARQHLLRGMRKRNVFLRARWNLGERQYRQVTETEPTEEWTLAHSHMTEDGTCSTFVRETEDDASSEGWLPVPPEKGDASEWTVRYALAKRRRRDAAP